MSDYALASLLELRAEEVTAAQRAHLEAQRQHEAACAQTAEFTQTHRAHEEATRSSLGEPMSAADAGALHAWRLRRREEAGALRERIALAEQAERASERNLANAHDALLTALREKQVVDAHYARWKLAEREKAERSEENEHDERR